MAAGSVWGAGLAAMAGTIAAAPWTLGFVKAYVFGIAGLAVAGERAGHVMRKRRLAQMTRGEVPLSNLTTRTEGELVVVRGTIEAGQTIRGLLVEAEGVYRRLELSARGKWVHEAAVDFALRDDAGHRILVQAAGARWMIPPRELFTYPGSRLMGDQVPRKLREVVTGKEEIKAIERVLPIGAHVQIVGYKTAIPDATGDVTGDYRSAPTRATLRSGDDLPLVITRVEDLG